MKTEDFTVIADYRSHLKKDFTGVGKSVPAHIGTMALIHLVNKIIERFYMPKFGISVEEFALFALDIKSTHSIKDATDNIVSYRIYMASDDVPEINKTQRRKEEMAKNSLLPDSDIQKAEDDVKLIFTELSRFEFFSFSEGMRSINLQIQLDMLEDIIAYYLFPFRSYRVEDYKNRDALYTRINPCRSKFGFPLRPFRQYPTDEEIVLMNQLITQIHKYIDI
jgi:hypothetical protein